MHVIFTYDFGQRTEAILLAAGPDRLRVVVRKTNDTLELRLTGGRWISEDSAPVEIESLISDGEPAITAFYSRFGRLAGTASN